jgi:hypothetical protein
MDRVQESTHVPVGYEHTLWLSSAARREQEICRILSCRLGKSQIVASLFCPYDAMGSEALIDMRLALIRQHEQKRLAKACDQLGGGAGRRAIHDHRGTARTLEHLAIPERWKARVERHVPVPAEESAEDAGESGCAPASEDGRECRPCSRIVRGERRRDRRRPVQQLLVRDDLAPDF